MSKFKKISSSPSSSFTKNLGDFAKKFKNKGDLLSFLTQNKNEQEMLNFFSGENAKRNLNYLTGLLMGYPLNEEARPYNPDAFQHVLEVDDYRGFDNTKASQGAYEMMTPDMQKELEDFKKNPPKNLIDYATNKPVISLQNENISESDPRYKAMKEKLSSSSSKKFVKTSANDGSEDLKKVVPQWTIENVLQDMAKVANNKMLSDSEKQKNMFAVLNQYERSIAPLSEYLQKNGIKPE